MRNINNIHLLKPISKINSRYGPSLADDIDKYIINDNDFEQYKDILFYLENTPFDMAGFSFTNFGAQDNSIYNRSYNISSAELVKLYTENNLHLYDPMGLWVKKAVYRLLNSNEKLFFTDFESLHNHENGVIFKNFRNCHKIYSGGISVVKIDCVIFLFTWFSSFKKLDFHTCYSKLKTRLFFTEIEKAVVDIYQNKKPNIIKNDSLLIENIS